MENMGLKGQTILVTGGAGFIGGCLVEELLLQNVRVVVVDKEVNPRSFFALKGFTKKTELVIADIRNRKKILSIFKRYKPTYVIHLAAEPIVAQGYDNPYQTFETNIMGTIHILEAARANPYIKGIIVASSDKAYGKTSRPYTEESPLRGDHPYDVSKSSADLIAQAYYKTYDMPVVITRFGNVYGEGDLHMDRIIPGICESIIKNKSLKVRSDGTYVRDYVYVKDVVNGYITLLKHMDTIRGDAFNFSSENNLSVLELIKKSEKILDVKIPYEILNIAKNEIPYQHLIDKKIKKLGWKTQYSFDLVLPKILKWYSDMLSL